MRILHTVAGVNWGGLEHRVVIQSAWLRDHGHDVQIVCPADSATGRAAQRAGVAWHPFEFTGRYNMRTVLGLRAIIRDWRTEVLDCHGGRDAVHAMFCRDLCGVVYTRHLVHPLRPNPLRRIRWQRGYDHIIATCALTARAMLASGLARPDAITVVGEWAEEEFFAPTDRPAAKHALGLDNGRPVIGVIGMLRPDKGQDDLIRALPLIAAQAQSRPQVVLIGGPTSESQGYRDYLVTLAAELGVTDDVRFLGHRDDVAALIPALDLVVVPSRLEAQSRAVPQAFARGRPVVAANVGALSELVHNGENGWVYETGSIENLARSILSAISHPDEMDHRGKAASGFAQSNLRIDRRMEETLAAYGQAVRKRRANAVSCH